jgi:hypothetical protein
MVGSIGDGCNTFGVTGRWAAFTQGALLDKLGATWALEWNGVAVRNWTAKVSNAKYSRHQVVV